MTSRPKDIDDVDPLEPSLEESALERARAHVAELEAEARLADETEPQDPAAPPAAPRPPAQTREQADAEALAEFQKLRERGSKKTL